MPNKSLAPVPLLAMLLAMLLGATAASPAAAQETRPVGARPFMLGVQAIGLVTRVSPAYAGRDLTEGYLTQPAVMAHARLGSHVALRATIDFEGLTLRRGELTPGAYGEGYLDRRHPHTYAHELIASLGTGDEDRDAAAAGFGASLSVGRGFAPFGTDDPMTRPFVKFPANHHLAQILERAVAIVAVRRSPVVAEVGLFNGDEPTGPSSWPTWRRFGDSWAGRLTLAPRGGRFAGLELQASHAWLTSPEFAPGGAGDQRKWSASARLERGTPRLRGHRYALVEWARTDDVYNGEPAFDFTSLLGEGRVALGRGTELAVRFERTVRPEEQRQATEPFRAIRPHTDASILGRTRLAIVAAHAALPALRVAGARFEPLIEVARSHATEVDRPSAFEPALFYGSPTQWTASVGVRLGLGATHHRMGRYGIAATAPGAATHGPPHARHGARPKTDRASTATAQLHRD